MMQEVTRLCDIMEYQQNKFAKTDALCGKRNGVWIKYSTHEIIRQMNAVSLGLLALGMNKDSKIALISTNRPEWNIADLGILQMGGVSVPLYPTATAEDYKYIINHSDSQVIFVENIEFYKKITQIRSEIPNVIEVISFEKIEGVLCFEDWMKPYLDQDIVTVKAIKETIQPTDLATLVYTSGTTGNPKGVMLSHDNLISNVRASTPLLPVDHTKVALSFLPLCHVFERMVLYVYMTVGCSVYYAESLDKIGENLVEVKPHFFTTVPRLLEKVYDKIVLKGTTLGFPKKNLFFWALQLAHKYELENRSAWYDFQLKIARKLVFSKWKDALGGRVEAIVSGAAALQERLSRVFWGAGIPVCEGYGMTETSPVVSVNYLDKGTQFGTVGKIISNVQVKIAEEPGYRQGEGEILVKGPNVMMGYYKNPEATQDCLETDGWYHSGDIGMVTGDGFLKITDRKKEIFKTSGGKYIAPQKIENFIKESLLIEQCMVVGEAHKFPAVLLIPSFVNLKDWCNKNGIPYTSPSEIVKNAKVLAKIQEEIDKANANLAQYEKIKKFVLLPVEWSVETNELTPSLKLKRRVILSKFKTEIESMYVDEHAQNG